MCTFSLAGKSNNNAELHIVYIQLLQKGKNNLMSLTIVIVIKYGYNDVRKKIKNEISYLKLETPL